MWPRRAQQAERLVFWEHGGYGATPARGGQNHAATRGALAIQGNPDAWPSPTDRGQNVGTAPPRGPPTCCRPRDWISRRPDPAIRDALLCTHARPSGGDFTTPARQDTWAAAAWPGCNMCRRTCTPQTLYTGAGNLMLCAPPGIAIPYPNTANGWQPWFCRATTRRKHLPGSSVDLAVSSQFHRVAYDHFAAAAPSGSGLERFFADRLEKGR